MGNPMQYRDSMSMSWSAGRQLSYMYKGNDCLMFDYNADGIRTKKLVGSNTTEYLISDGVLTALKFDENTGIYFMRDESGVPYGFTYTYDGIYALTDYYYQYNLQGDVVAILDSSGNIVAKYDYDAWGKLISMTDGSGNDISNEYNHIGRLNPLRYRGYIYDEETGFYYLGSRYYDPVTGRFINADSVAGVNGDIFTYNLYVYCGNNPANRYDYSGKSWQSIISGVLHGINTFAISIGIDTAAFAGAVLDMKKIGDTYHAEFNCWQRFFGYNDLYDELFDLGTDMISEKFEFQYNGQGYTIWAWKGDYINLGAGAELGIYVGDKGHRLVDTSLAMGMGLTVQYKGELIVDYFPLQDQWWITGFNPNYLNVKASDLIVTVGLTFYNYGMYSAFKNTWKGKDTRWQFHDFLCFAMLTF